MILKLESLNGGNLNYRPGEYKNWNSAWTVGGGDDDVMDMVMLPDGSDGHAP